MKVALITGITGQDGPYLADKLLAEGYEVHGLTRWIARGSAERRTHADIHYHNADLTDGQGLMRVIQAIEPDELYNLGAITHVPASFEMPEYAADVNAMGTLRILEAIRLLGLKDKTRFYQASTSEMFGQVRETPQREETPFQPRSPYAIAKLYAHWITVNYREAYGLYAATGILFNHESPQRDEAFVTRKITRGAAEIAMGLRPKLSLGNLDAERDWGHARDYVEAIWLILQQDVPGDYVVSSGETHSVREFAELAFQEAGLPIRWEGQGLAEQGLDARSGRVLIDIDARFYRPVSDDTRRGDSTKARTLLNWQPRTRFADMVREMVRHDLASLGAGALAKGGT